MRHFFALTTSLALPPAVGALALGVKRRSAKAALVASPRLAHVLTARLLTALATEAVHVAAITAPADLHQYPAALAAVDPVL